MVMRPKNIAYKTIQKLEFVHHAGEMIYFSTEKTGY